MNNDITKLPIEEELTKEKLSEARTVADFVVSILDSKKARDIKLLHVEKQTIIADYFVVCTGTSRTQIRSLADEVEFKLGQYDIRPSHIEGADSGIWVLEDFGSVILHVFTPEARQFYNLEKLYQDTTEENITHLLTED